MREVATTLTDYLLTVLCLLCAWRLATGGSASRLKGPVVFFAGFAAAAFFGGTWHGFFSTEQSRAQEIVWWLSMLFAGVTAAGLALTGLELLGLQARRPPIFVVSFLLVIYAVLAWRDPRFVLSLMASIVGTLLCVAGLIHHLRRPDSQGARLALAGLCVSILAALAQQRGIALDPSHFDHNATYHLMLLPALGLVYSGFLLLSRARGVDVGEA